MIAYADRVSFWSDKNAVELNTGDSCVTLWIH